MSSISNLIKNKRTSLGLTQSELAKMIGVTSVAISKWELGLVNPKPKHCQILEKILGISAQVLLGTEKIKRSDYVDIPFYSDTSITSDNRSINEDECTNEQIMVPLQAIKGSYKKDVICLSAKGDSMLPVFGDGAILAIDKAIKEIHDGMIYVVSYNGLLKAKVLFRVLSGVRLCSFNPMFKDEEYNNSELNEFKIIGKVIWYSVIP